MAEAHQALVQSLADELLAQVRAAPVGALTGRALLSKKGVMDRSDML